MPENNETKKTAKVISEAWRERFAQILPGGFDFSPSEIARRRDRDRRYRAAFDYHFDSELSHPEPDSGPENALKPHLIPL